MTATTPLVSHTDVEAARRRIGGRVRRTPTIDVEVAGRPVTLKLELLQHTGSLKPRGMYNRLLSSSVSPSGVVTASGGNAGLAAAYAAATLGPRATVFVPGTAPAIKTERIQQLGADIHLVGTEYADALEASRRHAADSGALELHAYDQVEVVAGQGTCGAALAAGKPVDVTEPAGVVALAPLLSGALVPRPGERTGIVLCGANTDPASVR